MRYEDPGYRTSGILGVALATALLLTGCDSTTDPGDPSTDFPPGPPQVWVQAVHDQAKVAIRFEWESRPKDFPEALPGGNVFPGQVHDPLVWNGDRFDRFPAASRLQEDRLSMMIGTRQSHGGSLAASGCYITCHTGMERHNVGPGATVLDMWHWRGGRSGPMGYAEDTGVGETERIRDSAGSPPSSWLRATGDRLREDQAAILNTGYAPAEGFPRFVFQKGKELPGGFQIPRFFLWNDAGDVIQDPLSEVPQITDVSVNRSLLVVYQDRDFDPVDKVNAIDVGYLVHVVNGATAHLPDHLQTSGTPQYAFWTGFWTEELGIGLDDAVAAAALLEEIRSEWEGSGQAGMVTRSVGFIFPSSQHAITAERDFDTAQGRWMVTMYRSLDTGDPEDVNMSGLPQDASFYLGFAVHDRGAAAETHDISLPYRLATATGADIRVVPVADVRGADWTAVPTFEARFIRREFLAPNNLWTLDWLLDPSIHEGYPYVNITVCQACHGVDWVRID
jgi:hypothetical protein